MLTCPLPVFSNTTRALLSPEAQGHEAPHAPADLMGTDRTLGAASDLSVVSRAGETHAVVEVRARVTICCQVKLDLSQSGTSLVNAHLSRRSLACCLLSAQLSCVCAVGAGCSALTCYCGCSQKAC